jgi:ABC-type multidrug transport system fused ATPase/permease subunit
VTGSILENVSLVEDASTNRDKVMESLVRAGLGHFTAPENWFELQIRPDSGQLSGGEIQRLGLARALYRDPKILFLDEATSALDAATEASVASSIKNVGGETTVIVIAHRLSTIQDADQVHVMDAGKIIASGTFSEIRKAVPMVEEYVQLMSFRDE